eukprot:scaffold8483_cov84-Skeletonema_marinoi.AAC.2
MTVEHALRCKAGGLVHCRHNDVARDLTSCVHPDCRLYRHLGRTRRSFLLQGRAARGEILSDGGRGRQVPTCSLESSASRVAQRSIDFFTTQRRDVARRKPPLGAHQRAFEKRSMALTVRR